MNVLEVQTTDRKTDRQGTHSQIATWAKVGNIRKSLNLVSHQVPVDEASYISLDETTQLHCVNMPGSPVVDIQTSFGATFIGLLVSTTSVLPCGLLHRYFLSYWLCRLWGLMLGQT